MTQKAGYPGKAGIAGLFSGSSTSANPADPIGANLLSAVGNSSAPQSAQSGQSLPLAATHGGDILVIGGSTVMQNNVVYNFKPASGGSYQRTNGIVTLTLNTSATPTWAPGMDISIVSNAKSNILLASATILTMGGPGNRTVTFADPATDNDPRSDYFLPRDGSDGYVVFNSVRNTRSWLTFASMACDGRVNFTNRGVSGSSVGDWASDQGYKNFLAASGKFDAIVVDFLGNALLAGGLPAATVISQCKTFFESARAELLASTQSGLIYCFVPPANRNIVAASTTTYNAASLVIRWLERDAPKLYPWLRIIPIYEAMTTQYGTASTTDVINGWPEAADLDSGDSTHFLMSACDIVGFTLGQFIQPNLTWFSASGGIYPDFREVAVTADPGGQLNTNGAPCWYGNATTASADAPFTGTKFVGTSQTIANPAGGMTGVCSVVADDEGGKVQLIKITDNVGTAGGGTTVSYDITGSAGDVTTGRASDPTALLTFLTSADVVGRKVDILYSGGVQISTERSIAAVECRLLLTIGGTQYTWAAAFANDGSFGMGGGGADAMLWGFDGLLRMPRFTVPAGITAAKIRFTIATRNNTASGVTTLRSGPDHRWDVVPTGYTG